MTRPTAAEQIMDLLPGQVFVFGSNVKGLHAGGAARTAHEKFGAIWGQGEGLQGDSYAIPTMGTLFELEQAVARFLSFAERTPERVFLLTPIGTGIAGWPTPQIARLFTDAPENVLLPQVFMEVLDA